MNIDIEEVIKQANDQIYHFDRISDSLSRRLLKTAEQQQAEIKERDEVIDKFIFIMNDGGSKDDDKFWHDLCDLEEEIKLLNKGKEDE